MGCRFCGSAAGEIVLDLGCQPACEYFPPLADPRPDATFPLRLWLCARCALAQLADDAELPDEPQGIEPAALAAQRSEAIAWCAAQGYLTTGATVAEGLSPHEGSWLPGLARHGLTPASDGQPADLVVDCCFGLMHASDQRRALARLVGRLAPGGRLLLQFHSLAAILRHGQWNAVRLGHYAYYSTPALCGMLVELGLTVTAVRPFDLYGGTVLLSATRGGDPDASVAELADAEIAEGVRDGAALKGLQAAVDQSVESLRRLTDSARAEGASLYGYSAASRAVALLYLAGVDTSGLSGIADASPAKQGRRMPGTSVPVISPAALVARRPNRVLVFVSDLLPEVRQALPEIERGGGRWLDLEARRARARQ